MKKSLPKRNLAKEPKQKSLGALHRSKQTKPRSPALTGKLRLQRHTLEAITADLDESGGDEEICNIAAWPNRDSRDQQYISIELSPKFKPQRRHANEDIFDIFDDEDD